MSQISTEEAENILKDDVEIAERYIQRKLGYIGIKMNSTLLSRSFSTSAGQLRDLKRSQISQTKRACHGDAVSGRNGSETAETTSYLVLSHEEKKEIRLSTKKGNI